MSEEETEILIRELIRDEGMRLKCYRDSVGKLTVGVGRNLDDVGISVAEAELMLKNDISEAQEGLTRALPWWTKLDPVRQRVLVNLCFNMGITKLLTFKNTLEFIRCGQYADAADAMKQSLWHRQVGKRAERLEDMMRKGATP